MVHYRRADVVRAGRLLDAQDRAAGRFSRGGLLGGHHLKPLAPPLGFADGGGFADRIAAADIPSTNVEDAAPTSAADILASAMLAYGVDPLRLSRFAGQPAPANNPLAQSANTYIQNQNPAWWRRPASHLGYDPDEVAPRAKGGSVGPGFHFHNGRFRMRAEPLREPLKLSRRERSPRELTELVHKVEAQTPNATRNP